MIALSQRGVSALRAEGVQMDHQEDAVYLGSVTKRFKGKPSVGAAQPGSVCYDRYLPKLSKLALSVNTILVSCTC